MSAGDQQLFRAAWVRGSHAYSRAFEHVAQSSFRHYGELERYGWTMMVSGGHETEDEEKLHRYRALGVSPEYGMTLTHEHREETRIAHGHTYNATLADCQSVIMETCFIDEWSEMPPVTHYGWRLLPREIIPLQSWSDVAFLQWQYYCTQWQQYTHKLRYIDRRAWNSETDIVARAALERSGHELRRWNDRPAVFTMESEEGKAILGSTMGEEVANFVSQHQEALDGKYVSSVVVYTTWWKEVRLCFALRDLGQ